jgi:8-oxo-dGTP pyrophosphatase MutT (NUDIX family)
VTHPRPAPGEELNPGAPTTPRRAATVILLRGGERFLEVLLARRTTAARFMAGVWVFPGGAVDAGDGDGEAGLRTAALREVQEEAGIALGSPDDLIPYSRWITPPQVRIRFDTWFFLAIMPPGQEPRVDGAEIVEARWYVPADALAASAAGELELVFPTMRHLQQLASFASTAALLDHARGREVRAVEPHVVGSGEQARIVLPGEPGYDG